MKLLFTVAVSALVAMPAFAQEGRSGVPAKAEATGAGMPDMTKMGPMARLPKNEKQDQKELAAWHKAWGAAHAKGDMEAIVGMVDFPVLMMTDTMKGEFRYTPVDKEPWVAMMKPHLTPEMAEKMKGMKHKGVCAILSDDLASCEGEMSMAMGKQTVTMRGHMTMTRVAGQWKVKSMMEAGWGDMNPNDAPAAAVPAMAPVAPATPAKPQPPVPPKK